MSPHFTALRCVFLVAMHHGVHVTPEQLMLADEAHTLKSVVRLMRDVGIASKILKHRQWKDVTNLGSAYPAMAISKSGHWVIVVGAFPGPEGTTNLAVMDPQQEQTGIKMLSPEQFGELWDGTLLLCKRRYRMLDVNQPFGLRWFLPEIMLQYKSFRDIAVTAVLMNLISMVTPLLLQVMIDKVVPHQSYQTLGVVVLAYVLAIIFEGVFSYVRQNLMIFATNKIDAKLASRTYEHLLRLPLPFFESSSAGVLIRHMQQSEIIRNFLTGRLFQTLLDAAMLPILLVFLATFSVHLTLVVLFFSLIISGIIGVMVPTFRRYLEYLYAAEGSRQADMVETIHGMRAVKSLALEPLRQATWDNKVVQSVRARETVGRFSAFAMVITNAVSGLMSMSILGLGCLAVFDGILSVGSLVAFNMLSGRVTGPLIQIVTLINEYQQTALAVRMLGHVMNAKPERDPNQRGIMPTITGQMEFDDVTFTYDGGNSPALEKVSFQVNEGQIIGVVGRSGSGKTTVTRLIQGIHSAQSGLIRLNGNDVRHVDLRHLRRSIGVVLQDNILFAGTIRDNIAASKPNASLIEVVQAARLAGADEFIDRLPLSYETRVEENATNFSGGQKQRIAIARALLTQPKLLIFDEATSALDPESEAIIQQNLNEIAKGRTMIIVSHRLSSLVQSDGILVLERGKVADFAPHATLVQRCDIYRHLWQQQTQHILS